MGDRRFVKLEIILQRGLGATVPELQFFSSLYSNLKKTRRLRIGDNNELVQPPGHKTGRQAGTGFTGSLLGVFPVKIMFDLLVSLQLSPGKANPPL